MLRTLMGRGYGKISEQCKKRDGNSQKNQKGILDIKKTLL